MNQPSIFEDPSGTERTRGRSVVEFKDRHKGKDIWVIASGPSMNFVDPDFFQNKITIGVNRVNQKFDCDYVVAKDGAGFAELTQFKKRAKLVFSKHESGCCDLACNSVDVEHWVFEHPAKLTDEGPDLSIVGTDQIVVSYSTITSALHLAAYMGASNIMICGHDCGAINGNSTMLDYYSKTPRVHKTEVGYFRWLGEIEGHTLDVIRELRRVYGVNVHSLNPFINFNLDGNHFESATRADSSGELSIAVLREPWEQTETKLKNELLDCRRVTRELRRSMSFRIGRLLTWPLRRLNEFRNQP